LSHGSGPRQCSWSASLLSDQDWKVGIALSVCLLWLRKLAREWSVQELVTTSQLCGHTYTGSTAICQPVLSGLRLRFEGWKCDWWTDSVWNILIFSSLFFSPAGEHASLIFTNIQNIIVLKPADETSLYIGTTKLRVKLLTRGCLTTRHVTSGWGGFCLLCPVSRKIEYLIMMSPKIIISSFLSFSFLFIKEINHKWRKLKC